MAPVRHPLLGLIYNDETGRYINMLERKITIMTLENLKMRALLELLTGDMWDDVPFKAEDREIHSLAVDTLVKRLRISRTEARRIVDQRFNNFNPPAPEHDTSTYLIEKPEEPRIVPHSVPLGQGAPFDHKKHLQGLETAAKRRRNGGGTFRRAP
jgi:hypothetical protein